MRLFCCWLFALALTAAPSIRYELSFANAAHHEAEVRVIFHDAGPMPIAVVMSRSSPGRYALHEFAKNISHFRAVDESGQALETEHLSPNSWRIKPGRGDTVCSYTLFADHADGTYSAVDETHAHLNMPATLVWAQGWRSVPVTLTFQSPEQSGWKAATQLMPQTDGSFYAPNLDALMDSPLELSALPMREWKWHGATFRLALHHTGSTAQADAFLEMCKKVVAEEEAVFGSLPRFDNGTYTFLADFLPYVKGDGMEHRNSTVITAPLELANSSRLAIATVSHEFFHAWNVRRIRPESLEPFDFERTNSSSELWFAEGFTSYYGNLVLCRTGLSTLDEFLTSMGDAVNAVVNSPGRKVYSASGMSALAPFVDAATSIDATNVVNNYLSYYTYGEALAFGIDLTIRARYPGKSLDDWMRTMWREHPDVEVPYTMSDLEQALGRTVGDAAFAQRLFEHNIKGLEPLDYASLVRPAGLALTLANPDKVWLGSTRLNASATGISVAGPTLRESPLYAAGVDEGDEILGCRGESLTSLERLTDCISKQKPGTIIELLVKKHSGTGKVIVRLAQDPTLALVTAVPLSPQAEQFRRDWLQTAILGVH